MGCYDNTGSFGELALMYNTPRAATIIARTEGCLWALDRSVFRKIVLQSAFKKVGVRVCVYLSVDLSVSVHFCLCAC